MSSKILIKRSTTSGSVPTTSDLDTGELGLNTADKRVYTNNAGTIVELGTYPSSLNVTGNTDLDGTLNVDGASTLASGTVTGNWTVTGTLTVSTPTNSTDAASKGYVDTAVANVIDSAPGALDTLNELAAAINDDANFATTITNSIATKLALAGGTMTGDIVLGSNKITTTADPATDNSLTRKSYVDGILGSATDAATSAAAAATSATNAANSATSASGSATTATTQASAASSSASAASTSETNAASSATSAANSATAAATSATAASTSATNAATSETNAAASYDSFDDRYLGAKSSAPSVDNDGEALLTGAIYFDTTDDRMYAYDGSSWVDVKSSNGSVYFGDGDKAIFGAGSDLQIYHDGSDSYINDTGTGSLLIRGSDRVVIQGSITGEGSVLCQENAEVQLRYDNATKLATTSTGIDVTGTVTADGLTVENTVTSIDLLESDVTDQNTRLQSTQGKFYVRTANDALSSFTHRLMVEHSTGDISFYEDTGTTPKFFWDASVESLGIGTSSPSNPVSISGSSFNPSAGGYVSGGIDLQGATAGNGNYTSGIAFRMGTRQSSAIVTGVQDTADEDRIGLAFFTNPDGSGATAAEEAMRIDSSGRLLVGTTSAYGGNKHAFDENSAETTVLLKQTFNGAKTLAIWHAGSSTQTYVQFYSGGSAITTGSISTNGSSTSYNTSSDYRLKEDWQPMSGSIDRVKALNPVNFAWKVDGSRVDGFLAHEAQEVVPEAVHGTKDAVDAEGNPEYQGIDQSKLTPLLTAALKDTIAMVEEQQALIQSLTDRIAALEN